jgi:hypothetical protein
MQETHERPRFAKPVSLTMAYWPRKPEEPLHSRKYHIRFGFVVRGVPLSRVPARDSPDLTRLLALPEYTIYTALDRGILRKRVPDSQLAWDTTSQKVFAACPWMESI